MNYKAMKPKVIASIVLFNHSYDDIKDTFPGKIHEHARIYRLRSVAGSQILNFMS
ncbi:hypothetical protein [Klebsiella quasipneumoniae]|uniref:hypothetical protein n=1 Tax=Klebsiella quasipneumoniae TaxID=1463165 RepID=UPI003F6DF69E